jgi:DNA-directed RNA polymerase specialized sigma24 family protein
MTTSKEGLLVELDSAVRADAEFARRSDDYLSRALGLAFYILGDAHEAEDATQEAMARAWKARRSLRQIESFDA